MNIAIAARDCRSALDAHTWQTGVKPLRARAGLLASGLPPHGSSFRPAGAAAPPPPQKLGRERGAKNGAVHLRVLDRVGAPRRKRPAGVQVLAGWAPRAAATATVGPPDSRGKGADSERKQGASSRSRPTAGSAGASSRSASSQPVAARISTGCASAGGWE